MTINFKIRSIVIRASCLFDGIKSSLLNILILFKDAAGIMQEPNEPSFIQFTQRYHMRKHTQNV